MKHKANILLIGNVHRKDIESIPNMKVTYSYSENEITNLVINNNYDLILSSPSQIKISISNLVQNLDSIQNYFSKESEKKFKHIVLTSSELEETICEKKGLLFYPAHRNLKPLILQILSSLEEAKQDDTNKSSAIIDFEELFIRVDNNREFIKKVIERFFELKDSRIQDILLPIEQGDFTAAKDAAHKLKGVLGNFAMNQARASIIELEKLILNENSKEALLKIQQLDSEIESAREFYQDHLSLFQNSSDSM